MAQLNMMNSAGWNQQLPPPWIGSNFNGSNMSLNLPPQHFMQQNDGHGGMWNPWMQQQQQQQYPFPVMPNGGKFFFATIFLLNLF